MRRFQVGPSQYLSLKFRLFYRLKISEDSKCRYFLWTANDVVRVIPCFDWIAYLFFVWHQIDSRATNDMWYDLSSTYCPQSIWNVCLLKRTLFWQGLLLCKEYYITVRAEERKSGPMMKIMRKNEARGENDTSLRWKLRESPYYPFFP